MGVYSVFFTFVTQFCSPSNVCVCVWSVDTHVYTQSSLSIFTTLGTAVLSSPHPPSWLWLVGTTVQTVPGLHHITDTVCEYPDSNISKKYDHIKMADDHDV